MKNRIDRKKIKGGSDSPEILKKLMKISTYKKASGGIYASGRVGTYNPKLKE
jgi:hypothetical protein